MEGQIKKLDALDNEVLETIFSYLSFEDRKNVRLLCRKFRKVCGFSRFSQFEKLVIRPCYDTEIFFNVLRQSRSEILHLELRNMKLHLIQQTIWIYVRNKLTTLSLTQCFISTQVIIEIVDKCDRLRYLELFRITDSHAKPKAKKCTIKLIKMKNILVLRTAFQILAQRNVRRENLEALHINIVDSVETFSANFLNRYISVIFPGIKVICITDILFHRSVMVPPTFNDRAVLTYNFSINGRDSVWYGWLGSSCHIPMLTSPEGFRQLISIRCLRYQFLFFIKQELEESILSDVLRQRANANIYVLRRYCPILFNYFIELGYFGNVVIDATNRFVQFSLRTDGMLFSRNEFLTVLNSYLNSQNLGIFQLEDDDLFFYWMELPFEKHSPSLCITEANNIPEHELCQLLQPLQIIRQLKLIDITDNVLAKVFACQKELLCLHVRMSTYGCSKCHYSAYKFNENWLKYEPRHNYFHNWDEVSIRNLTNLQCLILDYSPVSDIVHFAKNGLDEFVLPALRHFRIYGTTKQKFLWMVAKMVALNAPDLELLEFTGGCNFNFLTEICAAGKNLHYLRVDFDFVYQPECKLHYTICQPLFRKHEKLQVISQNNFHFFYDRSRGRMCDKLHELPPYVELKRCPFAPSMHS